MNKKELYKLIDTLNLPKSEYCVLSGGALVIQNIREFTNDLDIDITKKGFEMLKFDYSPVLIDKDKKLYTVNENIECFLNNDLEKDIVIIDGYPCQSLISVYKLKKRLNRGKDQKDILAIEKALNIKQKKAP